MDGEEVTTLRELLAPGLRAVFVGINPSLPSVAAGHYYQGRLGRRLWRWLPAAGITGRLPPGAEDDAAFVAGFGFADVVRLPTATATSLTPAMLREAAPDLLRRLSEAGVAPPTTIVFVYAKAFHAAGALLADHGFTVRRLPGFYAPAPRVQEELAGLAEDLP